jgi:MYXO-CTERM domain-containing protein
MGGTVRFELETPGPATVEVAREVAAEARPQVGPAKTVFESRDISSLHVVAMTGLEPATAYSYFVRAGHTAIADGHFATAPKPDSSAPVTFLVYGDDRTDDDAHAAVVRAMMQVPSDFLVQTGDMVADGGSAENWQTFFDIERPILRDRPLLAAIGNHELYDDAAGANFGRYFGFSETNGPPRPYGTARFGNIRFFFLNGMHGYGSGEERLWLEHQLAAADGEAGVVWRFVVVHHSPWSAGPHGPNAQLVDARVPELLAAHKVDLLFAGHAHLYERGDAVLTKYIVSGGGGAPVYRNFQATSTTRRIEAVHHFVEVTTSADAVRIVARRSDGSILDRCGFAKGSPWDCDEMDARAPSSSASLAPADAQAPSPGNAGSKGAGASAGASATRCLCDAPGSATSEGDSGAALFALLGFAGLSHRRRRVLPSRGTCSTIRDR